MHYLQYIRNFLFVTKDSNNQKLDFIDFFNENLVLILVITVCVIWIIAALIVYIIFATFKWSDKKVDILFVTFQKMKQLV